MRAWIIAVVLAGAGPALAPASAEVKSSGPDHMVLEFKGSIPLPRKEAWNRAITPSAWWSDAHTYSGKASNIVLEPEPGGCWCETWSGNGGGEVEHGRVLSVMYNSMIRLDAPFGPLQELGLSTAFTITLADGADDGSTDITFTYRANGSSASGLDVMAGPVDGVLGEQFARLVRAASDAPQ